MKQSDGGKGSSPRPFSVSEEEYAKRWDAIFGRDKVDQIIEDAEKYLKENRDKAVYTTGIKNALDNLKQKENMIIGRTDISGAEKAKLLKEIEDARASLHPTVLEMRKHLYKK